MSRICFEHDLFQTFPIERIDDEIKGRYYQIETGERFRSVTSILGDLKKHIIDAWKERVGHDEAEKISKYARDRGTKFHDLCERHLHNIEINNLKENPLIFDMFKDIKTILDNNVGKIYGIEQKLFSHRYQCAGTADLICEWNDVKSVVDFKTSKRISQRNGYKTISISLPYIL
jgi:genome maintenance exonuclease 1